MEIVLDIGEKKSNTPNGVVWLRYHCLEQTTTVDRLGIHFKMKFGFDSNFRVTREDAIGLVTRLSKNYTRDRFVVNSLMFESDGDADYCYYYLKATLVKARN